MKLNIKKIHARSLKFDFALKYKRRKQVFENSNNTFDPKTFKAYSYNWWQYVGIFKGQVVFNDYNYSNTTNGHQADMRRLLDQLGVKKVITVKCSGGLQNFQTESLYPIYEELLELELFGHRRKYITRWNRKHERVKVPYTEEMRLNEIKALKKTIKFLRSLGAEFKKEEIKALRARLIKQDEKRRAEQREKSRIRAEQKKALKPALSSTDAINFLQKDLNSTENVNFLNLEN